MGRNYQRGVEPWESSRVEQQGRVRSEAAPKTDRQKRRARKRKYQWLLFAMIALILAAAGAHLYEHSIPFSQLSVFGEIFSIDWLEQNGVPYTVLQVCSALTCAVAWCFIRLPAPYPAGLLLLPCLQLLGWVLLSFKKNFGYNLLMTVLILTEIFTGFSAVIGIVGVLGSMDRTHALVQEAFYIGLFLYPLLELIVLRKWKENIY